MTGASAGAAAQRPVAAPANLMLSTPEENADTSPPLGVVSPAEQRAGAVGSTSSRANASAAAAAAAAVAAAAAAAGGVASEAELRRHIKTSDDVVEFYAQFGQDSPVPFFFCVRQPRGQAGKGPGPYELAVVPREAVGAEYCTISASGVMHMRRGVQAGASSSAQSAASVC